MSAAPNILHVIARKRDGLELTSEEIGWLVRGYTTGEVPDYQAAAWLMAAFCRGLSLAETAALTRELVASGTVLAWGERPEYLVDKHSTGGVGDKASLVVGPLVAAAGAAVVKMSGRGLGFTGGTIDKLEAIPGFLVTKSPEDLRRQVRSIGLAIVAQTPQLAPADGKLYALRDATATVESLPLIAASVMSKKIAAGAPGIVLDVKCGRGAFAVSLDQAEALASLMIHLGREHGRRVAVVISAMDQPLGRAVGNALEVREAIETLRGVGPADLVDLSLALGSRMLLVSGSAGEEDEALARLREVLETGQATEKLASFVQAQGGDPRCVEDPGRLPAAPVVQGVAAEAAGYVAEVDARVIGETVVGLGGGRTRKEDPIDHAVGLVLRAKKGDRIESGDLLLEVHARDRQAAAAAAVSARQAYSWSAEPVSAGPVVLRVLAT